MSIFSMAQSSNSTVFVLSELPHILIPHVKVQTNHRFGAKNPPVSQAAEEHSHYFMNFELRETLPK